MFKYDVPYMCTHQIDPGESESEVYFGIRAKRIKLRAQRGLKKRKKFLCSNMMFLTCVPTKSTPGNQNLRFILEPSGAKKVTSAASYEKKLTKFYVQI